MSLIDLLPATAEELIEQTGRRHESVYGELVALEAKCLARVELVHSGHRLVAVEWHRGVCAPEALCIASRDGFCDREAA